MLTQRRFISIGGRSTRAGSGNAHSRTSIKQVSAIPTAPGSPGKNVPQRAPTFVPLSRITQPQARLRPIGGKWKHIDTSFSDLQGVSDLVITPCDVPEANLKTPLQVAETLIRVCKEFMTDVPIARFANHDMSMNSGPEQDSIQNYTLKRRQWFAVVRAFYNERNYLWQTEDAATLPVDILFELISTLDTANYFYKSSPRMWEDEPSESYQQLPLSGLVKVFASAALAQGVRFSNMRPGMVVGCVGLSSRYGVRMSCESRDFFDDARFGILSIADNCLSRPSDVLALIQQLSGQPNFSDVRSAVTNLTPVLKLDKEIDASTFQSTMARLYAIFTSGKGVPFENFSVKDLACLLIFSTALYETHPACFAMGSSISRVMSSVMATVDRIVEGGERWVQSDEGYDPLEDFEKNLRLSHPDVHPHLRLRKTHAEGKRESSASPRNLALLLEAHSCFLEVSASANLKANQRVVAACLDSLRGNDLELLKPHELLSTLEAALSHHGASTDHPRIRQALSLMDACLSSPRFVLSPTQCERIFHACGRCGYLLTNAESVVRIFLRENNCPWLALRATEGLSRMGLRSVPVYHAMAMHLISTEEESSTDVIVKFLDVVVNTLGPYKSLTVVQYVLDERSLPSVSAIDRDTSLACARILASQCVGSGFEPEEGWDEGPLLRIASYLACSVGSEANTSDIVNILLICVHLGMTCPEVVSSRFAAMRFEQCALEDTISSIQCASTLSILPDTFQLVDLRKQLQQRLIEALEVPIALSSSTASVRAATIVLLSSTGKRVDEVYEAAVRHIVRTVHSLEAQQSSDQFTELISELAAAESKLRQVGVWHHCESAFSSLETDANAKIVFGNN